METNRLRYFCLVAELENLRKAAEHLGISHSALSKSLKVLESQLSQQLLVQTGRNIKVTEVGKRLYPQIKAFLKSEEALFALKFPATSPLRLGAYEGFSTYLIGSTWQKYFGDTSLELHELLPGQLEQALVDRKIDFGVTTEPVPLAGIDYVCVGRLQSRVFKRRGAFEGVSLEQLPFVAPLFSVEGLPMGAKLLDGWPKTAFIRNIRYRVDMMESALALVRQGVAAVYLPEFIARFHNRVAQEKYRLVPVPLPAQFQVPERSIYLMSHLNEKEGTRKRTLAKLLRIGTSDLNSE